MQKTAATRVKTGFAVLALGFTFVGPGFRSYFGDTLYLIVTAIFALGYVGLLIRSRQQFTWRILPTWLVIFFVTALLALLWLPDKLTALTMIVSFALPALTALGMSTLLPWPDLVRAIGATMRWLMGLWIATQLIFLIFRFEIQGILPTGVQLAFVCLIALSVFATEFYDHSTWRPWTLVWIVATLVIFVFQMSVLAMWALGIMVVVLGVALLARVLPLRLRFYVYLIQVVALLVTGAGIALFWPAIQQTGVGATWRTLFTNLTWFAVLALLLIAFGTLWRSWFIAIDRPRWNLDTSARYNARTLLPLLITVSVLVYSCDPQEAGLTASWLMFLVLTFATNLPSRIQLADRLNDSLESIPAMPLQPEKI